MNLQAAVAAIPDKAKVYADDIAQAREHVQRRVERGQPASEKSPKEAAIDGVAHYVFNTLRGADDDFEGHTFEDVRAAIIAQGGF